MNELTFITSIRNQHYNQLEALLRGLRAAYKHERIVVINDGDKGLRDIRTIQRIFNFEFVDDRNNCYFGYGKGGLYLDRFFNVFASSPTDYMILIDSDARVFRKFKNFPYGQDAFGPIATASGYRYFHGGVSGFSKALAVEFAKEKFFARELYRDPYKWATKNMAKNQKLRNIPSQDVMVTHGVVEKGVYPIDYSDWFSTSWKMHRHMHPQTRSQIKNRDLQFSITHPWKVTDMDARW